MPMTSTGLSTACNTALELVGEEKARNRSSEYTDGAGNVFLWNCIARSPGPPDVLGRATISGASSVPAALGTGVAALNLSKSVGKAFGCGIEFTVRGSSCCTPLRPPFRSRSDFDLVSKLGMAFQVQG